MARADSPLTDPDMAAAATLHGLVDACVKDFPNRPAVLFEGHSFDYAQMSSWADRLAAHLQEAYGIGAEDRVGLMMTRSHLMPTALLAVLRTGAAYVPMDPKHPADILSGMMSDAQIKVLLVDCDALGQASLFDGPFITLDLEWEGLPQAAPSLVSYQPDSLAYVIFTSGSTGRPKGVAVTHRAAANTVNWRNRFYGFTPEEVVLQIPSYAFDSSVVDMFCTLSCGGKLVIPSEPLRLDTRYLNEIIHREGVTGFVATPSYYKPLLQHLNGDHVPLRWLTMAGEALTIELVRAHYKKLPDVLLYNEYGPTECAVCATAVRMQAEDQMVTIGSAVDGMQAYILDQDLQPVPDGQAGELCLSGTGLARGYLGHPELTAAKFVANAVSLEDGQGSARMYRTGDRVRLQDDQLVFLGRLDNQVKIRGFRVELDEIERVLYGHPLVNRAAVLCKGSGEDKYLAAYVELSQPESPEVFKEHCRRQLAYYMVPQSVVVLEQMPLNYSAKIDRRALTEYQDFAEGDGEEQAHTDLERDLLALMQELFKERKPGIDDNFFELGGNSLKVIDLVSKARSRHGLELDVVDVYNHPNARDLAACIQTRQTPVRN